MDRRFLDDERFARAEALFKELVDLPLEQREAELQERCPDDPELVDLVLNLFGRDAEEAGAFLEPPSEGARRAAEPLPGEMPRRIGRFEIVRKLGEGGMGTVYEAVQEVPRRPVALKIIRPLLAGTEMHQRFQREIELLGRLNHPGIAQIYEAGAEATGRGELHYFAMEYIAGRTLLDYMREHDLNVRQRLLLVARICEAVQFAHGKGVIHRDLKPGNIMVEDDTGLGDDAAGVGRPKILDFGVAHVLRQDEEEASLLTRAGQVVGTLAYMSPEQVAEEPLAVDERADVYALGVILYEALTGQHPHDLTDLSLFEAGRVIRTTETASVSTLDPSLRGDVDTIVAKAMAKDREHRYGSAADLASDIHRHLRGEPIKARPAGVVRRVRLKLRRRRDVVSGMAVTLIVTTLLFGATQLAQRRGEGAPGSSPRIGLDPRWTENAEAYRLYQEGYTAYNDFCDPLRCAAAREAFQAALDLDPDYAPALAGLALTVLSEHTYGWRVEPGYLARAMELAGRAKAIDPTLALAWTTESFVLYVEGRCPEAAQAASKAIELDPGQFEAYESLFQIRRMTGDWPSALAAMRRAIEIAPDRPKGYMLTAYLLTARGEFEEAERVLAEGLERLPNDPQLLHRYGTLWLDQQRYDEAGEAFADCADVAPDCWRCLWGEIRSHWLAGRESAADSLCELMIAKWPESPIVLGHAAAYQNWRRDFAREEELLRQAVAADPYAIKAYKNLAISIARQGRADEAEAFMLRARDRWPGESRVDFHLAELYAMNPDRLEDAEASCLRALAVHPDRPRYTVGLGQIYRMMGRNEEAVEVLARVAAGWPGQLQLPGLWRFLSEALAASGRLDEAVTAAEHAVELAQADKFSRLELGERYLAVRRWHEAGAELARALDIDPEWQAAHAALASLYEHEGLPSKALEICASAAALDSTQTWPLWRRCHLTAVYLEDCDTAEATARDLLRAGKATWEEAQVLVEIGLCRRAEGREPAAQDLFRLAGTTLESRSDDSLTDVSVLTRLGMVQFALDQRDEARRTLELIAAENSPDADDHYRTAIIFAGLGDTGAAIASIDKAVAAGFSNWHLLNKSPGLSGVRGNPEFARILESVRP